jgi:hypothetical protein
MPTSSPGSGYIGGWYASGITAASIMETCHRCVWTFSERTRVWSLKAVDSGCPDHGHGGKYVFRLA